MKAARAKNDLLQSKRAACIKVREAFSAIKLCPEERANAAGRAQYAAPLQTAKKTVRLGFT
jgi:hypothetical protein